MTNKRLYIRPRFNIIYNYIFSALFFFGGIITLVLLKDILNIGFFSVISFVFISGTIIGHFNFGYLSVYFYTDVEKIKDGNFTIALYNRADFVSLSYLYDASNKSWLLHHEKYPAFFNGCFLRSNDKGKPFDTGVQQLDIFLDTKKGNQKIEPQYFIFGEEVEDIKNVDHLECYKKYRLFRNINLF
jgi:hypothetical protein